MTLPSVLAEPPITDLPPDPTYENADEVRRRAMFWAGKAGAGGKAAHAELIRQALVDPVKVRAAIGRLSQLDHTILSVVARYGGCTHASIVTLEVPMPGDLMRRGHHFDPPVRNLTRLGVLVDASGSSDSWSYDLTFGRRGWLALQPAIASELVPAVAPIVDVSGLQAEAMSGAVGRSAVEAFDEARNVARTLATLQPVKLTKAGALLRPLFDKLTKRLPALANEEAGYPPDRAAFVVASLRAIGVVRYAAGQPLSVDDAALRRISAGAPAAITHTLLRGWLNASSWADGVGALRGEDSWSYRGDDILAARRSVVWHLGALARGGVEWCSLRRLLERIYASGAAARHMLPRVARVPPFIMALASRTLQHLRETTFESWLVGAGTAYASMLIDTLPSLGVIEAAGRADGDIALRLTDAGRIAVGAPELQPAAPAATTTGPCLVVQPNDDVLVYLDDADRETLHLLATIADRAAGGDRVQTYRLSKETPMRAAEHGLDIDQLLAWLTVRARYPLPSRVSITLREWAANVRAVTMIKDVALTFGAPAPSHEVGGASRA